MNNIQSYLSVFNTIYYNKKFVYMSTPITTGKRYVDWYPEQGCKLVGKEFEIEHHKNVVEPNVEDAKINARQLFNRLKDGESLINPAIFSAAFSEKEYNIFWGRVIEEHVSNIVFAPGWEYSKGCLIEMMVALGKRIPVSNIRLERLQKNLIKSQLEFARLYLDQNNLNSDAQKGLLSLLK